MIKSWQKRIVSAAKSAQFPCLAPGAAHGFLEFKSRSGVAREEFEPEKAVVLVKNQSETQVYRMLFLIPVLYKKPFAPGTSDTFIDGMQNSVIALATHLLLCYLYHCCSHILSSMSPEPNKVSPFKNATVLQSTYFLPAAGALPPSSPAGPEDMPGHPPWPLWPEPPIMGPWPPIMEPCPPIMGQPIPSSIMPPIMPP